MKSNLVGPAEFGVSPTSGFLPEADPLLRLPQYFDAWECVAADLPKFLVGDSIRETIADLPEFPIAQLASEPEWERAMVLLSFLGHAYVWSEAAPADRLPSNLAKPWHAVATRLGRPPVLSYASYCLHNWRRLNPNRPVKLGNIGLIQNFLAGEDEEWFVLIHVDIEVQATPAIATLQKLVASAPPKDEEDAKNSLILVAGCLEKMNRTMDRMPDHCDPYIYFRRVRPYIHGWRDHPGLPKGVIYEGVAEYADCPQTFRGETGAQSGIIPALDAAFGIRHESDHLRTYLMEMRDYMPPRHKAFVERLESRPNLRDFATQAGRGVNDAYNACVEGIERFRSTHLQFAAKYIFEQNSSDSKNPGDVGTGGTPFMPYLRKHRDETRSHRISVPAD